MATETKVSEVSGKRNPDAITGAPGSHPGATGIGSASGAATGAVIGMAGGPVGAIIGGVAGAAVGGWLGHEAGEWNDPSEAAYWKDEYKNRSYFDRSSSFDDDVAPAYRYGGSLASQTDAAFDSVEEKARTEWDNVRGKSKYSYDQARSAISDAYERQLRRSRESLSSSPRSDFDR